MNKDINGFINIYKEQGFTSSDAVAIVRGIFGRVKTGHTGTLDPMATGVLPICLGKATKLADFVQAKEKIYKTSLYLGISTDTCDIWGKTISSQSVNISETEISQAITSFIGEQEQTPPMYSAVKIGGKKLYELAREGITVERKSRTIHIYDIYDINFTAPKTVEFTVRCSKGTYIRTLCSDIGQRLGCGGVMSALERLASGSFVKETAVTIGELKELKSQGLENNIIMPIESVLREYGKYKTLPDGDRAAENGNKIRASLIDGEKPPKDGKFMLYSSTGRLVGIFRNIDGFLKPVCMLV